MPSRFLRVFSSTSRPLLGPLLAAACLSGALLASTAHATRIMDLRAEQLIFMANDLKASLALSPNQQTLFQQVGTKSAALMRTRQLRRDRLQADLKRRLAEPEPDLRAWSAAIDEETATAAAEDRQLREFWLGVHDALDDKQRATVVQTLLSQLERVDADIDRGQRAAPREGQPRGPGGGRGQRSGGGMGMPGS